MYYSLLIYGIQLLSKRPLCLDDKQNDTWLLVDMKFLFSCSTRLLIRELSHPCIILYLSMVFSSILKDTTERCYFLDFLGKFCKLSDDLNYFYSF